MHDRAVVSVYLFVAVCGILSGCARSANTSSPAPTTRAMQPAAPPVPVDEPLGRQVSRASERLHGNRFSGLLHFENPSDVLFVSTNSSTAHIDSQVTNTGRSSLVLAPGAQGLTVKLSSVLVGRDFPGDWTLVGLYLRSDEPASASLSCEEDGRAIASRTVALPAGQWVPAMLDISALAAAPRGVLSLELRFDRPTTAIVRCDDVLLIDNHQTIVDASPDGWIVKRAGLGVTCVRKLRFNFGVVTKDGSPDGWEIVEANALRARFASTGETKALTLYSDGRSIWDGTYKPLSVDVRDDPAFTAAHLAPADVRVPEAMGRVVRNSPGDANNDGYDEHLGAYQLQADGPRLEATLSPRTTAVPRPVLQIAGMPEGKTLITIEGRLVERSTRLDDGQLLIELPARITRPTLVTIRIQ